MSNLPKKIKLDIHGETIEFSLTNKREIKYYGKTETSNESLWRIDKLDDNEVFYQTEWGWGVFITVEERELSDEESVFHYEKELYSPLRIIDQKIPVVPTKLITITYNNETVESYE
jgi:hypothetical protein